MSMSEPAPDYDVIRPHAEPAAIIPLHELRVMKVLKERATPEELDEAEIQATLADYRDWEAAGRPGAIPHEVVAAELLGGSQC
jgi:hypothetical protein